MKVVEDFLPDEMLVWVLIIYKINSRTYNLNKKRINSKEK